MTFYWMEKDVVCAKVDIDRGTVTHEEYVLGYEFMVPHDITVEQVYRRLESRCFDRNGADCDELLEMLGLRQYSPIDILRITHGRRYHDDIWVRFDGETLTWDDVKEV